MWLQAAYIYEALLNASPVFNPLSRTHKPVPFRSEPYPISTDTKEAEERKNKQRMEDGKEAMRRMMDVINKRFVNQ